MAVRVGGNGWIRKASEAAAAGASRGRKTAGIDERFLEEAAGRVANVRPGMAATGIAGVAGAFRKPGEERRKIAAEIEDLFVRVHAF